MTDDLRVRVQQGRAVAAVRNEQQQLLDELPAMERALAQQERVARAEQVAFATEQQARAAVQVARPELADWRQRFQDWSNQGRQLVQQLGTVEGRLLPALDLAIRDAVGAELVQLTSHEQVLASGPVQNDAVDRLLANLGASDLEPFPPGGDSWADQLKQLVLQYSGRVYLPTFGRVNFQRRGRGRGFGG